MPAPLTAAHLNDPVSRHMRPVTSALRVTQTVGEALAHLREHPPEERIIYFYVVDDLGQLHGVIPTRRLLLSPPEKALTDIMVRDVIALPSDATVLDACEFFILHRFLALPVVDSARRLLGAVDVEMYTDEISDLNERNDDLFQLIGVHLAQARQRSAWANFRTRFPWLICNIVGGTLAAFLSGVFADVLRNAVALALFIPVVLSLAESVSIQSVSLALQALHGQQPSWASLLRQLPREFATGVLLGTVSGALVAGVALAWLRGPGVAGCILAAIGGGVAAAAIIGLALPVLLRLFRLDPQVAAGPIALAATDFMTLLLYFSVGRWLLY